MRNTTKLFVGLATFAKGRDLLELFNDSQGGASGWIGGRANDQSEFLFNATLELSEAGYTEIEIEDVQEIRDISKAYEFDQHLGKNMEDWEPGKHSVWGSLYPFSSNEYPQ
ncbi:MAG: hypothetical protein AAF922_15595 [Pseudomonadota bacterium]